MNEMIVKTSMTSTVSAFLLRLALAAGVILGFALMVRGGGPKCVARTSYFDPATTGQVLTWPLGQIAYFTDQGDLSPILPNASANSLVASAFGMWTSVPTAALATVKAGSLAEDVNGTNVIVNGNGTTWLTASGAGASYVTATLAPGVYSPSKSVTGTLSATQSSSDIGIPSSYVYVSQGASVSFPVAARVLSNGSPRNNVPVNFSIVGGSASLSPGSTVTDANGYASATLSVTGFGGTVQGLACVAPGNFPCGVFYVNPVRPSQQVLQRVAGGGQVSTGQAFQPVVVRVVDSAASPHSVIGAPVNFLTHSRGLSLHVHFPIHWSTQSFTVLYQSSEFWGFRTQWPSSGK